jgi:hypothetical protein
MLSSDEIREYVQDANPLREKQQFDLNEARAIGDALGIPWDKFGVEQFRMGLTIELEHGRRDQATDVTHDEPLVTGKIALAHLNEIPDYYTRLAVMELEAERFQSMSQEGGL